MDENERERKNMCEDEEYIIKTMKRNQKQEKVKIKSTHHQSFSKRTYV